jgi:hypothetical protein
MVRRIIQPDKQFTLSGDIYQVQQRPGHAEMVVNQDYSGISIVRVWEADTTVTFPFAARFAEVGIIDSWCIRADGDAVLLFNADKGLASLVLLTPGLPTYDISLPSSLRPLNDLRYFWKRGVFWLTGCHSDAFYALEWQEGSPHIVEKSSLEARKTQPAWMRMLDQLPVYDCTVERVRPDNGRVLFHTYKKQPGEIGVISWKNDFHYQAPAPQDFGALAFQGGRMFVLYEYEIQALSPLGTVQAIYPAPQGFHYTGFDTVPESPQGPAALLAIASALDDSRVNQVQIYRLDRL